MITESAKSGVQLKFIRLVNTQFEWFNYLENPRLQDLPLELEVSYETREAFIDTHVIVSIGNESESEEDNDFYLEVEMVGVFEKVGDTQLSDEEFAKVNAAAIIFPYIRQYIRAISLEAGLTPIILPLVNFHSWYKNNKKENS